MHILIVDDSTEARELLRDVIQPIASKISECDNGTDAVRRYMTDHPDLVLMDIRMPGLNGIEATKRIQKCDASARVILISQYDELMHRAAAIEAGAECFFAKGEMLGLTRFLKSLTRS